LKSFIWSNGKYLMLNRILAIIEIVVYLTLCVWGHKVSNYSLIIVLIINYIKLMRAWFWAIFCFWPNTTFKRIISRIIHISVQNSVKQWMSFIIAFLWARGSTHRNATIIRFNAFKCSKSTQKIVIFYKLSIYWKTDIQYV
jgi:hypothetical protein